MPAAKPKGSRARTGTEAPGHASGLTNETLEAALQQLRQQAFQLRRGQVAELADADEQERVRGVLGLAEGVLQMAVTNVRVTRDGRAYVDPDLSAATRCLELVARLLGVLEVEAKAPVVLSEEQLRALMRRAGYDLVATGEEKPAG